MAAILGLGASRRHGTFVRRTPMPSDPRFQPSGFHGSAAFLPDIRRVACNTWTRHQPQGLGRHAHPGCWEIHLLVDGVLAWWVGERRIEVRRGDCFVARPGEEHSGMDAISHRSTVCWLSFALPARGGWCGLPADDVARLRTGLEALPAPVFPAEPLLTDAFATLLAEGRAPSPTAAVIARAAAVQAVASVVRAGARQPRADAVDEALVQRAIALIAAGTGIAQLAAQLGIGRTTLYERFLAATGMSPKEYELRLRLRRALALLRGDLPVHAVAAQAGYASPQHLARAVRAATGLSPQAWRTQAVGDDYLAAGY
jgi:AraC-like DNA-binding protein